MSNEGGSQADRDLLARLNALKKTHIDLDNKQYQTQPIARTNIPDVPSAAKELHQDLVSRFKSLNGTKTDTQRDKSSSEKTVDDDLAEEDEKTVEELLAELGGEGAWNFEKDEATQIEDLLRSANFALATSQSKGASEHPEGLSSPHNTVHELPSVDIEVSRPSIDTEDDDEDDEDEDEDDTTTRKSKKDIEADLDREADDIIAKVKDELKNAPTEPSSDSETEHQTQSTLPTAPAFDLPDTPSKDPPPPLPPPPAAQQPTQQHQDSISTADTDLAARFASLNLPTNSPKSLPSAPSSKPGGITTTTTAAASKSARFGSSSRYAGHTDDEIDSWCVICLEDATLRCLGCDGDLFCPKCWVEGHRGPDAGYEERSHRAVEYHRGGKKEEKGRRKVAA